jgi:hypothetical protein
MEHFRVSDTILRECIFPFVGEYQFRFVGAVSRDFNRVYVETFPNQTTSYRAVTTVAQIALCYDELNGKRLDKIAEYAASLGNIKVLKYMREKNNNRLKRRACAMAARYGHLETLKWLREVRCPWDEYTCTYAAKGGHLECLQWLRRQNCPWNEGACSVAARGGHLEVLKWLREEACPRNESTFGSAAEYGCLEILQWLYDNHCPWNKYTTAGAA